MYEAQQGLAVYRGLEKTMGPVDVSFDEILGVRKTSIDMTQSCKMEHTIKPVLLEQTVMNV